MMCIWLLGITNSLQRSPLFCANIVKKDPGRARQKSLTTAGTNFTKPGAQNKGDLCILCFGQICVQGGGRGSKISRI